MHTVWKGAISFGLVHVPVKMFSATEDKDISMRMIHKPCSTPLSYVRKCQTCNTEVQWEDIVKGYEYEQGRFVIFNKEELELLAGEANKEIKILDFVNLEEIDPVYFQKTYYLAPSDTGSNAYNLLLRSLTESGKIGIAKVSIRSKSSLAAIRVIDRCLAMETIFYPDEIRPVSQVPNLPESAQVNEKELTMAKLLIEQLSTPFEPEKYTDEYRSAVLEAIQHKVAGEEIQVAPEQQRTNVIDLMSALQASLDAVKSGGEEKAADRTAVADAKPKGARGKKAAVAGAGADAATAGTPAGSRGRTATGGAAGTAAAVDTESAAGFDGAASMTGAGSPAIFGAGTAAGFDGGSPAAAGTGTAAVPAPGTAAMPAPGTDAGAGAAAAATGTEDAKPKRGRPRKVKETV